MPSRKRSRGKQRKAKAVARRVTAERQESWLRLVEWGMHDSQAQCNHGWTLPDADHVVLSFMDSFYLSFMDSISKIHSQEFLQAMIVTIKEHPEVWIDTNYRKMIRDIIINIGTNIILQYGDIDKTGNAVLLPNGIVGAILLFEVEGDFDASAIKVETTNITYTELKCYIGFRFESARDTLKWMSIQRAAMDVMNGGEREQVRFFAKRLACSCLKDRYARVKSQPKIGRCDHCEQDKERACLMVCSRCRNTQYCCVECQHAHWPEHKEMCDVHISASEDAQDMEK